MDKYLNTIIKGDCIKVMQRFPDNSIDSVITDPPYGLSFMGKDWDSFKAIKQTKSQLVKLGAGMKQTTLKENLNFLDWNVQWMAEAKRVLKPGGIILVFSGTRTQHLTGMALELSGFIIKDTLMWLYGSGFPKAMDIGKMIDKKLGKERKIIGTTAVPDITGDNFAQGKRKYKEKIIEITEPSSKEAKKWDGYTTIGLKPAYEPILLAYKEKEKGYVENALKYQTGGLNIKDCRINTRTKDKVQSPYQSSIVHTVPKRTKSKIYPKELGRFPTNVIIDNQVAETMDQEYGIKITRPDFNYKHNKKPLLKSNTFKNRGTYIPRDDIGGISRYFYCAKASTSEKEGVNHPTVKPLALMEWLCKLTKSPYNDIVLDPFIGSGTTAIACINTKRNFIGIEQEQQYIDMAIKRIENANK